MSYQVLARKWRPQNFHQLVGQQHVQKALINGLDSGRLHHAYLFTGTRGVGKTTIARIFSRSLNCEEGVSSNPCGICSSCIEISEGRFVDLIEVDAASRTKVEDTREILENVQYAPTRGRYKVYLIDEVHMLSNSSFNALLKTLEEPPEHVKFLLATTDPQKLPVTILSRCLQFNLKSMTAEQMVGHLRYVLGEEKVAFDEAALWQIARAGDGSMRDSLSLTDQAIAFGDGHVLEAGVSEMLGTIDRNVIFNIITALAEQNAAQVLHICGQLALLNPDFAQLLKALQLSLHKIAMAQLVPQAVDNAMGDRKQILTLAGKLAAEDVQLFYQMAVNASKDLAYSADVRTGFEMALMRMLAFMPQLPNKNYDSVDEQNLISQAEPEPQTIEQVETPKKPEINDVEITEPVVEEMSVPVVEPTNESIPVQEIENTSKIDVSVGMDEIPPWQETPVSNNAVAQQNVETKTLTEPEAVLAPVAETLIEQVDQQIKPPALVKVDKNDTEIVFDATISLEMLLEDWSKYYWRLSLTGLSQSVFAASHISSGKLEIDLSRQSLFAPTHWQRLLDAVQALTGQPFPYQYDFVEGIAEHPEAWLLQAKKLRHQELVKTLKNDAMIMRLVSTYDAKIIETTVTHIEEQPYV
jgi:DNA polymerase III subunit gamma/tau